MRDVTSQLIGDEEDDFRSYVENTLIKNSGNWYELVDEITSYYESHCISGLDYLYYLQQCDLDIKKAKKMYNINIKDMIEAFKKEFMRVHKIYDSDDDSDDDFLTRPSKETLESTRVYKKLDDIPEEEDLHLFQLPNMKYVWALKDGSCYEYNRGYDVGKWLGQIKLVADKDTWGSDTGEHYEIDTSIKEPEYDE